MENPDQFQGEKQSIGAPLFAVVLQNVLNEIKIPTCPPHTHTPSLSQPETTAPRQKSQSGV